MFSPTCFQKKTFKHLSNALLQKGCIMESISSLQIQVRYHTIEIFIVRKSTYNIKALYDCNSMLHASNCTLSDVEWQHSCKSDMTTFETMTIFSRFPYRDSSPKNKNSAIIYSPSCLISFIYFFSLQWKSMVTKTWSWLPTFLKITLFWVFHRRKENHIGLEWLEGE